MKLVRYGAKGKELPELLTVMEPTISSRSGQRG